MNPRSEFYFPSVADIQQAASNIEGVAMETPLQYNTRFSNQFQAKIQLKREDLQPVRSYKIRGAFHKMSTLTTSERTKGVVCASAGNHAQGVAFACHRLGIQGTIYMPTVTPKQKIEQTKMFGGAYIQIVLTGDTFDDAAKAAKTVCETEGKTYIHPFDDPKIIEGQGTIGLEIIKQSPNPIDYVFVAVGGGGLASGLCGAFKAMSPDTKIIGVEPQGAPSLTTSLQQQKNTKIYDIDKFIDGAAVQQVGELNFEICQAYLSDAFTVPEGLVCQTILDLYNKDAIVVEPAGALTLAALHLYAEQIKGKNVVCILSGSNNDITRTAEIKERALLYAELKHYFIVRFPQRAGALKFFVTEILGPDDDITHFEYTKKANRENGAAVVGVELKRKEDLAPLISRLRHHQFFGEYLNDKPDLFQFLV